MDESDLYACRVPSGPSGSRKAAKSVGDSDAWVGLPRGRYVLDLVAVLICPRHCELEEVADVYFCASWRQSYF